MRVMTWNLWWQFGPWAERQPAIETELLSVDPDILLLQEVYCDSDEDQATRIAERLGFEVARTTKPDGEVQRFGNAILSRWPVIASETVVLPNIEGNPGHRSALFVEIDTPRGPQLVVCTHLEWRYDQSPLRVQQLQIICEKISAHRSFEAGQPTDLAPILGGDFNSTPDSDELRGLTGLAAPHSPGLIFTDSWAATNEGSGFTWVRANEHSCDAQWPNRRLDYVLVAWPRLRPQMNPLATELAGTSRHDGITPSDHYAVVATLDDRLPSSQD